MRSLLISLTVAGFLLETQLFIVLLSGPGYRILPMFTMWVGWDVLRTGLQIPMFWGSDAGYRSWWQFGEIGFTVMLGATGLAAILKEWRTSMPRLLLMTHSGLFVLVMLWLYWALRIHPRWPEYFVEPLVFARGMVALLIAGFLAHATLSGRELSPHSLVLGSLCLVTGSIWIMPASSAARGDVVVLSTECACWALWKWAVRRIPNEA